MNDSTILNVGPLAIPLFGLMNALGLLACFLYLRWSTRRLGFNEREITDMFAPVVISGYLGSKLLLLVVDWETYSHDPLRALKAGGVFYGVLLAGGIVGYLIFRRWNINRWRLADAIAPSIALAQAFGRLGCLASGCCYGTRTDVPWAITMEHHSQSIQVHPTQIYESIGTLLLAALLTGVLVKRRFDGQVALFYILGYADLRFAIEFFRGDLVRGFVIDGVLSTSQFIALVSLCIAGSLYLHRSRTRNHAGQPGQPAPTTQESGLSAA